MKGEKGGEKGRARREGRGRRKNGGRRGIINFCCFVHIF